MPCSLVIMPMFHSKVLRFKVQLHPEHWPPSTKLHSITLHITTILKDTSRSKGITYWYKIIEPQQS